jgi:hypothetical protein
LSDEEKEALIRKKVYEGLLKVQAIQSDQVYYEIRDSYYNRSALYNRGSENGPYISTNSAGFGQQNSPRGAPEFARLQTRETEESLRNNDISDQRKFEENTVTQIG